MAVYLIAGKPGSGKSFWAVVHLLKKYFYYEEKFGEWFPKGDTQIISNIDDLRLEHYRLDELIEKAGGLEKCFCVEYQKRLLERRGKLLYIIDEANKYFDEGVKSKDIHFFFQYHRHLGIDMYLITTGVSLMGNYVNRAAEYRIQAHPRSKTMAGFLYTKIVEGDRMGKMFLRPDHRIFKLYRSMSVDEVEVPKSLIKRYLVLILVFGVVSVIAVYGVFWKFREGMGDKSKVVKKATSVDFMNQASKNSPLKAGVNVTASAVNRGVPLVERKGFEAIGEKVGKRSLDGGDGKKGEPSSSRGAPDSVEKMMEVFVSATLDGNLICYTNHGVFDPILWESCRPFIRQVGGRLFVPESKVRPPIERKRWAADQRTATGMTAPPGDGRMLGPLLTMGR